MAPTPAALLVRAGGRDFAGWRHYTPPGYPDRGALHNPWVPITQTGTTAYDEWSAQRAAKTTSQETP